MSEGEKRNYIMSADVFKSVNGLVAGHTYTILGVNEINLQGKQIRLVRMRNPW